MALTRKALKAMGLTEEQVDSIVEMHTEVTDDLKTKLKAAQEKADNYDTVKKELDGIKAKGTDDFKQKYNDEHKAFEAFKKNVENEKAFETKKSVFTEIAKKVKVSEKRINSIIRLEKDYIDKLELDKEGKLKSDSEAVEKFIKDNYDEYIVTSNKQGANTETPPNNTGGTMTKEEILKIKDTTERQKAIAENSELFGI